MVLKNKENRKRKREMNCSMKGINIFYGSGLMQNHKQFFLNGLMKSKAQLHNFKTGTGLHKKSRRNNKSYQLAKYLFKEEFRKSRAENSELSSNSSNSNTSNLFQNFNFSNSNSNQSAACKHIEQIVKKTGTSKPRKTKANPSKPQKTKENHAGPSKPSKRKANEAGPSQPRKPKSAAKSCKPKANEAGPSQSTSRKGKEKVGEPVYSRKGKEIAGSVTKSVNNLSEKLYNCRINENLLINENFNLFKKMRLESENRGKGGKGGKGGI